MRASSKACLLIILSLSISACAPSTKILDKFAGEQLITPYFEDIQGWATSERTAPNFSERVWVNSQNNTDAYAVNVTLFQEKPLAELRDEIDLPGRQACDRFNSEDLNRADSFHPTLYWETLCENANGFKAKILHLMIDGSEGTFHLQKSWQMEFNESQVDAWKRRFESAYVCDNRLPETPCPEVSLNTDN